MSMKKIGIVTNYPEGVFQRETILGVEQVAVAQGYSVLVNALVEDDQIQPITLPLAELAGLVIIANVLTDEELRALHQQLPAMVLISHRLPQSSIPAIIQNNEEGIPQLVDYLIEECGCRRIAFIQGHMDQFDGRQRDRAFRQALLRHQLLPVPELILPGEFDPPKAAESVRALLASGADFDALLASDYLMGSAALQVLREAGVSVPEQVSVVGFGDGVEAESVGLTTVAADIVELGQRGARLLMAQIAGLHVEGVTWLNTQLIERDSSRRLQRVDEV